MASNIVLNAALIKQHRGAESAIRFGARCGVSEKSLKRAEAGLAVQEKTAVRIASYLGLEVATLRKAAEVPDDLC